MIGALLRRLAGGARPAVQAEALLPENLELAHGQGVRLIKPGVANGYATLANTLQGFFIFNHNDLGVGWQLANMSSYDAEEMNILAHMVRACAADPVILDIGANIGVTSVVLGRQAGPRGQVIAFEPQRVIFHMLAGNIALNSLDNVHCRHQAVGSGPGTAKIPCLDYRQQAGFGSVELNRETQSDAFQQAKDGRFEDVPQVSVDSLALPRVDMIKIDVEGMEADVLAGAARTLREQRPLLYMEFAKSDKAGLWRTLAALDYQLYELRDNFICVPAGHPGSAALSNNMQPWKPQA
jgi:FkbM family methyltransferase